MPRNRLSLIAVLLIVTLLVGGLGWTIYAPVRQERLNHALIAAIKQNDTTTALVLLDEGADPNSRDEPPQQLSLWRLLLDRLRGKRPAPSTASIALLMALGEYHPPFRENPAIVKALVNHGAWVNVQDSTGNTPLLIAVGRGYNGTVKLLLAHGADANRPDADGTTPLMFVPSDDPGLLSYLLDHGAKVDQRNQDGWTALTHAISDNALGSARILLDRGANINIKDSQGVPLLSIALRSGCSCDAVKLLLAHGADANRPDAEGWTPLMYAQRYDWDVLSCLLAHGAKVNQRDKNGWTALTNAVADRNPGCIKKLLDSGANINNKDTKGTPTLCAFFAYERDEKKTPYGPQIVNLLLDRGAPINARDGDGETLLMAAAELGDVEIVRLLIKRGADINLKSHDGKTALTIARRVLRKGKADPDDYPYYSAADLKRVITMLKQASARPTADTGRIAFVRNGNVWIAGADGKGERQLTRQSNVDTGAFARLSTDGRRFVWTFGDVFLFEPPDWQAQKVTSAGDYVETSTWLPGTNALFVGRWLEDGPDNGLWLVDTHRRTARRVLKRLEASGSVHEQNVISPGKRYLASTGIITGHLFVSGLDLKTWKPLRLPRWATDGLDGGSDIAWLDDDHLLVGRGMGIDPSVDKGGLWVLDITTRRFHRWLYSNNTEVDMLLRQTGGDKLVVGLSGVNPKRDIDAKFDPMEDRLDLVNITTRQRRRLPISGLIRPCQFSADGKQLLVLIMRPKEEAADAYIVDLSTGARRLVAQDVTDAAWIVPATGLSPARQSGNRVE